MTITFFKNTGWIVTSRIMQTLITAGVSIYITRQLLPIDFAVFAAMQVMVNIVCVLVSMGFPFLIIQSKNLEKSYSTIMLFQIAMAAFTYFILAIWASPALANLYQLPQINEYFWLLGLNILIITVGSTPKAIINKTQNFKLYSLVELIAFISSSLFALWLVINNQGILALIIPALYREIFSSIVLAFFTRKQIFIWPKKLQISLGNFHLISAQLINNVVFNVEAYSLGVLFNPQVLGFYNRAKSLENLFSANIGISLGTVSFPHLAALTNKQLVYNELKKLLKPIGLISFPVLLFMCFFAEQIVLLLFGQKWVEAAPFLSFLSIAALPFPINQLLNGYILASGKFNYLMRLNLINLLVNLVVFLVFPLVFNLQAVMFGFILIQLAQTFVFWRYTYLAIKISTNPILLSLLKPLFASVLTIGSSFLIAQYFSGNSFSLLAIGLLVSVIFYGWYIWFFEKSYFKNVITVLLSRF